MTFFHFLTAIAAASAMPLSEPFFEEGRDLLREAGELARAWEKGAIAPTKSADVRLRFDQLGPAALPFQAVRLQFVVANNRNHRLGWSMQWPEDAIVRLYIKGPGQTDYTLLINSVHTSTQVQPRRDCGFGPNKFRLILDPGESSGISFPLATVWTLPVQDGDRVKPSQCDAAFPKPGKYSIRCRYVLASNDGVDITQEATVTVDVREPQGDDKTIYQMLEKNPTLASALMSMADMPDPKVLREIRDIIQRFPRSTYSDYARYALARDAMARGPEAMKAAVIGLEGIEHKTFPYMAGVVRDMRLCLDKDDKARLAKIEAQIQKEHRDAVEFLWKARDELRPKEWLDYRKNKIGSLPGRKP